MTDALDTEMQRFLTDVVTAAGLLYHGKRDKKLAERISERAHAIRTRGMPEHWSDCATSNSPAYSVGPCDCGAVPAENIAKAMQTKMHGPGHMTDAEDWKPRAGFAGSDNMKRHPNPEPRPIVFPRSDPAALARFDPSTAVCTMNCGRHCDDPRTDVERRFQCDDCIKPSDK